MPIIPEVLDHLDELTAIRRDIHAHPEIGFEEERTAELVATKLAEWGCEVHRGLATTGVVGTIRRGNSLRAIGLRADMDCLPMQELNDFPHRSTHDGKMHACGHDGHTTMLLGAARYLAATRNFDGTVHFIFQPGEEGYGGGRVMVQEGLFEKFPCDAVFAMHNKPGIPVGNMAMRVGPMLAASDRFDIRIKAKGGHAAHPHLGTDPFVIGAQIVMALQTISSRNVDPVDSAVISIGFMRGGSAYNVIPDELHIGGTVRSFRPEVRDLLERRMGEIVRGTAALHGAERRAGLPPRLSADDQPRRRGRCSPPMSRPRSAARRRSTATSRRRSAARISRTCCWRAGRDAVDRQRPRRGRLHAAQHPLRLQRRRAADRGQLLRAPRRALPGAAGRLGGTARNPFVFLSASPAGLVPGVHMDAGTSPAMTKGWSMPKK